VCETIHDDSGGSGILRGEEARPKIVANIAGIILHIVGNFLSFVHINRNSERWIR